MVIVGDRTMAASLIDDIDAADLASGDRAIEIRAGDVLQGSEAIGIEQLVIELSEVDEGGGSIECRAADRIVRNAGGTEVEVFGCWRYDR
jgi:hypothetical protein